MRIAFWVSAAYGLLIACGGPRSAAVSPTPDGSTDQAGAGPIASQPVAREIDVQTTSGTRHTLDVQVDATVSPESAPTDVQVVGETEGALIVVDTHASIKGGLSYCQAGEERFLRVISLARPTPEETLRVKLASCHQNIELGTPGLEWHSDSSTLDINWLSGPAKPGAPAELTLRIGSH